MKWIFTIHVPFLKIWLDLSGWQCVLCEWMLRIYSSYALGRKDENWICHQSSRFLGAIDHLCLIDFIKLMDRLNQVSKHEINLRILLYIGIVLGTSQHSFSDDYLLSTISHIVILMFNKFDCWFLRPRVYVLILWYIPQDWSKWIDSLGS